MFSLFQQFSIILGGQENFIRQGASSLIVAEMCGNINTNESASSNAGRMGLMLIQLQLLSSIRCSFIAPLLCRYGDAEQKLIQAVASYLGEQKEL